MDFYDILKEASKNKKKAEKELEGNKRFNLNFRPKKAAPKPKVDRAAIAARIKKREDEEKIQAAIDEQKREDVLALRAEQEAAKSAARKRKVPSSSPHPPSTSREEKVKKKKKPPREDSPPRKERPPKVKKEHIVEPKKETYKDYMFNKRHAEEEAKSKKAKAMKDKGKGFSFKQLMDIAAANAGIAKPSTADQNQQGGKCQPNVKLKNKGRAMEEPKSENKSKLSSYDERRKLHDMKIKSMDRSSKREPTNMLQELLTSNEKKRPESRYNGQNSKGNMKKSPIKNHSSSRPAKSTCFPNTKSFNDPENVPKERSTPDRKKSDLPRKQISGASDGSRQVNPKRSSDGESRHKERTKMENREAGRGLENGRPSHHPVRRKEGLLDCDREPQRKADTTGEGKREKSSHHPVKRKGGWLDPVGEPARNPDGLAETKNERPSHHPVKRKGGWLDEEDRSIPGRDTSREVNGNTKRVSKPAEGRTVLNGPDHPRPKKGSSDVDRTLSPNKGKKIRASSSSPVPKKGGWLGTVKNGPTEVEVDRTISPNKGKKNRASSSSPVPHASRSERSKKAEAPRKQKKGWLDAAVAPAPPPESGGWLGSTREQSRSKSGGWLGDVREPAWQAKGGRLLSSEEEEEDSDLEGFIDDDPQEGAHGDVSNYIKEIFGYDKSRYKDESDYALRNMESSYSQMMKEEARSSRIAQQEDAEELRKEQEMEKKKRSGKR